MATKTKAPKIQVPADAPTKFVPIAEQRFETSLEWYDREYKSRFNLDVRVMTAADWLACPERRHGSWGARMLDNGMVLAASAQRGEELYPTAAFEIEADGVRLMRDFKSRLLAFLERESGLSSVEMRVRGDGQYELRCSYDGHDPAVVIDVKYEMP